MREVNKLQAPEEYEMTLKKLLYSLILSHSDCKCEIKVMKDLELSKSEVLPKALSKRALFGRIQNENCIYKGTIRSVSNQSELMNKIVFQIRITLLRKFIIVLDNKEEVE